MDNDMTGSQLGGAFSQKAPPPIHSGNIFTMTEGSQKYLTVELPLFGFISWTGNLFTAMLKINPKFIKHVQVSVL